MNGKTVLIIGLGKTGEAVAARAKAMDMTTIGVRAHPKQTPNLDKTHWVEELPSLWPHADFIVICVPLLDTTRGLLGTAGFAAMKETAVVIDISRGGVIDEKSMLAALKEKRIKGAALDVFTTEPLPAGHPFWDMDNILITPHCSSVYAGWDLKSVEMFSKNLTNYRNDEPLNNIVDPERGY